MQWHLESRVFYRFVIATEKGDLVTDLRKGRRFGFFCCSSDSFVALRIGVLFLPILKLDFDFLGRGLLLVVTCGNFPLESSYHKVPRCVYTSTGLYEYKGWDAKNANSEHRRFTWGSRSMERHVVDFYISDFQSGLRALVKAGYGSQVTPYVDESVVVEINPNNKDLSPEFLRWLQDRNLSCDDHAIVGSLNQNCTLGSLNQIGLLEPKTKLLKSSQVKFD